MAAVSKYQFPLRDLLILPAVIGVLFVVDGAQAFREGVPLTFAIWVAIRQYKLTTVVLVNPVTVCMVTASIWYALFEIAEATNVTIGQFLKSAGLGALVGAFYGVMACIYVVMARLAWESIAKASDDAQQ